MNPVRSEELPPLQNPGVLDLVFEHCSVADLKVCRQVSKVWRDSSLKAWRALVRVEVGSNEGKRVSKFLELVQNENSNHLESPFVSSYAMSEDSQLFWNLCGFSVKTLELCGIQLQSVDALRNVICVSCPNIEHLTLHSVNLCVSEDLPAVTEEPTEFVRPPIREHRKLKSLTLTSCYSWPFKPLLRSWMALLSYLPLVKTLKIDWVIPDCNKLFRSLSLIRERDPQNWQLKHVLVRGFHLRLPASLFHFLQDSRLRLDSLTLDEVSLQDASQVQEILRIHSSSLKKLNLNCAFDEESLDPISQLVNLQSLELDFNQITAGFLEFTPNLKKLELRYNRASPGRIGRSDMESAQLINCKELRITGSHSSSEEEDFHADFLRNLANCLPNVETLKAKVLRNEDFAVVCELWPDLVSLEVNCSKVDECGITGLDVEDVARINKDGQTRLTWRPITVPRANVTALKKLQSLYMSVWAYHKINVMELGSCSAVCGIQQLPQLRHLRMKYYKVQDQSQSHWKTLLNRFPHAFWE